MGLPADDATSGGTDDGITKPRHALHSIIDQFMHEKGPLLLLPPPLFPDPLT